MTIDEQIEFLTKGAVDVIRKEDLKAKLEKSQKPANRCASNSVPIRPRRTFIIGHTVVIRKLKAFQDLGHTAIFLIGDFTGLIGDPSGKTATRPPLSREEIRVKCRNLQKADFQIARPGKNRDSF